MECPNCGEDMFKEISDGGDPPVYEPSVYYACIYCGCVVDENGEESQPLVIYAWLLNSLILPKL